MNRMNSKKETRSNSLNTTPVFLNDGENLLKVTPKGKYSPLRMYSEAELAVLTKADPSFWAIDENNYSDKAYVKNMCELYVDIVSNSTESLLTIQHFNIFNLEMALQKLEKELPSTYRNICQIYGIEPKKHKSKKRVTNTVKLVDIINLCSWGYIEMFYPNIQKTITQVATKMYSSKDLDDITKAKYAHVFFVFLYTFNLMPYDLNEYLQELQKHKRLSIIQKVDMFQENLKKSYMAETGHIYDAIMLHNIWEALFQSLPDEYINIEMIDYFLNYLIEENDKLLIKEFAQLLTPDEEKKFKALRLKPLMFNRDIRLLKEKIFPAGGWDSDMKLFLNARDEKFEKAIYRACHKFYKNNFQFGQGVEPYKRQITFQNIGNSLHYTYTGYQYTNSPLSIRISDPNELQMMYAHLVTFAGTTLADWQ